MSAIGKAAVGVEEKKVGRAGGPVSFRHFLRFVVEIGEMVAVFSSFFCHEVRRVRRVFLSVVRGNGKDGAAVFERFVAQCGELVAKMDYIWAMVADESNEICVGAGIVV